MTTIPFCWLDDPPMLVADLVRAMERGDIAGAPATRQDNNHFYIEHFHLLLGHSRMDDDEFVLDYFRTKRYVRVDRRVTLVKVSADPWDYIPPPGPRFIPRSLAARFIPGWTWCP